MTAPKRFFSAKLNYPLLFSKQLKGSRGTKSSSTDEMSKNFCGDSSDGKRLSASWVRL